MHVWSCALQGQGRSGSGKKRSREENESTLAAKDGGDTEPPSLLVPVAALQADGEVAYLADFRADTIVDDRPSTAVTPLKEVRHTPPHARAPWQPTARHALCTSLVLAKQALLVRWKGYPWTRNKHALAWLPAAVCHRHARCLQAVATNRPEAVLCALLAPCTPGHFAESVRERAALLVRRPHSPAYHDGILSSRDIWKLLKAQRLQYGVNVDVALFTRERLRETFNFNGADAPPDVRPAPHSMRAAQACAALQLWHHAPMLERSPLP